MARRVGLLRDRLNERTLRSWAQTNEGLAYSRFKQPSHSGDATRPRAAGKSLYPFPESVPYQPALGGLRVLGRSFHPAGNGSFRHVEAEHQEFAMDARRTLTGIVSDHLKDQFTDLLGDPAATAHWIDRKSVV